VTCTCANRNRQQVSQPASTSRAFVLHHLQLTCRHRQVPALRVRHLRSAPPLVSSTNNYIKYPSRWPTPALQSTSVRTAHQSIEIKRRHRQLCPCRLVYLLAIQAQPPPRAVEAVCTGLHFWLLSLIPMSLRGSTALSKTSKTSSMPWRPKRK
jgi:hypothetical protein